MTKKLELIGNKISEGLMNIGALLIAFGVLVGFIDFSINNAITQITYSGLSLLVVYMAIILFISGASIFLVGLIVRD